MHHKCSLDPYQSSMHLQIHRRAKASPVHAGKLVPLEILPLGEFDPVYRSTLDVQSGELPVLPLSIYGAVQSSL